MTAIEDPRRAAAAYRRALGDDDRPDVAALLASPRWMADAACAEHPALEWIEHGPDVDACRAVCAGCLVREECLAYALAQPDAAILPGVWGGTTARERRQILRQRSTPPTPAVAAPAPRQRPIRPRPASRKRRFTDMPRCPGCDIIVGREGARCRSCRAA